MAEVAPEPELPASDAMPRAAPRPSIPGAEAAGAAALGLLGLALYVRLAPSAALASPARQRIAALLERDPGCTAGALARALGQDYKTVLHHLRVLRRAGSVMVLPGAQPRYFLAGALPSQAMAGAVVLRARSAHRLRDALGQGPARAADLARALGLSETTVSVQLRRLAEAGLVRRAADGRWTAA
jgi:DNA-binding transcriptional ArsR family regulator